MGAFEYTALDSAGPRTERRRRRRHRQARAPDPARTLAAAGHRRRGQAWRSQARARLFPAPWHLGVRPVAADAPARHAVKGRPAARRSAARGVSAIGEAARPEHHARRARQGHGRPHAGRRPQRNFRAYSPKSTDPRSRPARAPAGSMESSSAWPTTPRTARSRGRRCWGRCSTPSCCPSSVSES